MVSSVLRYGQGTLLPTCHRKVSLPFGRDGVEQDVATKELLLRVEEMDDHAMQDFLVEIKLMSALRHKKVVQFLGVTYFDQTLYLVTVQSPTAAALLLADSHRN